jgi:hypothetical protein
MLDRTFDRRWPHRLGGIWVAAGSPAALKALARQLMT